MQSKQKKRYHMDKTSAAVDDLPTAKVDTGYKPIDRKDEQTILPAKLSCLSGEHTNRPLQVWITESSVQIGVFRQRIARPIGNRFSL